MIIGNIIGNSTFHVIGTFIGGIVGGDIGGGIGLHKKFLLYLSFKFLPFKLNLLIYFSINIYFSIK